MNQTTIAETFVEFADTLTADFDVVDFLHQVASKCADILGVAAAGVLLTDQRGALRVVAASSERTRLLELLQLQHDEGPCLESFYTGLPVSLPDLAAAERWPRFTTAAATAGFRSVEALPMRLRDTVIGALGLFCTAPGPLEPATLRLARALGDVATIGIVQARTIQRQEELAEQLQTALTSRVIIEQAKGVIAERHELDMEQSFALLRRTARSTNRRLSDLAHDVVAGGTVI